MFSETPISRGLLRRLLVFVAFFMPVFGIAACGGNPSESGDNSAEADIDLDRVRAVAEYRLLQSELELASSDRPYLVLDLDNSRLAIRLKGATMWTYPLPTDTADSAKIDDFVSRFRGKGGRLIRPLTSKYLFAAREKTPDSVLAIVSQALNVEPANLQRDIPARFQLRWGDGLILEVHSTIAGKPVSRFKNVIQELDQVIRSPLGESRVVVQIDPEQALTLYRATYADMPTLLVPRQ